MTRGLIIFGAGGHGKVVADAALLMNQWQEIRFVDQNPDIKSVLDLTVVRELSDIPDSHSWDVVVAIGNNSTRLELSYSLAAQGYHLASIIHPMASVSQFAQVSPGTVVFANAVVNAGASIGQACIINTAATVDHDCQVADGVHISPGANLAGMAHIGRCSWVGMGAVVIQLVSIGENAMVGAGAVVIADIADDLTVAGVPAKPIGTN